MNRLDQEQSAFIAFAASDFFQLLSLSLQFPSKELTSALLDGNYKQDALNILSELTNEKESINEVAIDLDKIQKMAEQEEDLFILMRQEYTRLFNDPKRPILNIYESLFLHSQEEQSEKPMMYLSPAALHAERCYKEAGVNLISKSKEPADHLCIELEFLMYLYMEKGNALHEQDNENEEKINKQIQQFEMLHIEKWVSSFFDRLMNETSILPYKVYSKLAKLGLKHVMMPIKN